MSLSGTLLRRLLISTIFDAAEAVALYSRTRTFLAANLR
jgi:hypothetical protein